MSTETINAEQLADILGMRVNGSRWHKVIDVESLSFDHLEKFKDMRRVIFAASEYPSRLPHGLVMKMRELLKQTDNELAATD